MSKTAVVTGASSGIGWAVCEKLAALGWKVYGLSRRGTAPEGTTGVCADVTDPAAVRSAVEQAAAAEGCIDLMVCNAGFGISGPVEFASEDEIRRIMDVNFLGQIRCMQAVLPYMRAAKSGTIVCVSSVAAPIAIPYQAFYSAGKAAVNAAALALRNEVRSFGIKVTCVMPGDASTGFTDARRKETAGDGVYLNGRSAVEAMEKDERHGMAPAKVADVIVKAGLKKCPAPLYTAGGSYKLLNGLFKFLPARLSYWIVGKMYS